VTDRKSNRILTPTTPLPRQFGLSTYLDWRSIKHILSDINLKQNTML